MKQFADDLIEYIRNKFAQDSDISDTVNVDYSYKQNNKLNCPFISVQTLDNSDSERYDTFDGELISNIQVQIIVYAQQMKIANITENSQDSAMILADKIIKMFDKIKVVEWNKNVIRVRRAGTTFSMPLKDGSTTYFSPLRYEFYVEYNYKNI